jgi:erythromycin esterase-like protein
MASTQTALLVDAIRGAAHPLTGAKNDYDSLLAMIGNARLVLIGEASHGTHEFYRERALITRRLIEEMGFNAVAVEADWPDAYRVNRFVRNEGPDADSIDSLEGFRRFPAWMWRNADVLNFVGWLREHNDGLHSGLPRVGFYGLDLYSLHGSIEAVLEYLDRVDPEAATRARYRYGCFEHFGEDPEAYGYASGFGLTKSCEDQVIEQLVELQRQATEYAQRSRRAGTDDLFYAEQNARVIRNAERYYRTMFRGRVSSWNVRDRHMAETLHWLIAHLERRNGRAKVVVWAHNSHLGDARATDMVAAGELNVGQLVRERFGCEAVLIGLGTNRGTVTAASSWGGVAERKRVRPALPESFEALFHEVDLPRFVLTFRGAGSVARALREDRLERAIGVIYRPETELVSHYFRARLSDQFDAVIYFDETRAVEPLERSVQWESGDVPETFPSGM